MKKLCFCLLLTACSTGTHQWDLHSENDWYSSAALGNSDRSYTNGLKLTRSELLRDGSIETLSVGQNIYTPGAKKQTSISKNDRPYAAYLHLDYGRTYHATLNQETTIKAQAGIVGPAALGEQTQSGFHRLLGQSEFKGWDNQIQNEPTINLLLERKHKISLLTLTPISLDLVPNYGTDIGNVLTDAKAGGLFRLGKLPNDFGPTIIFPRVPSDSTQEPPEFTYYLFGGFEQRVIIRNIFLDGNTYKESHNVTKEYFVNDIKGGLALQKGKYKLTFTLVRISDEWKNAPSSHGYGSLDIGWGF